MQAEFDLHLWKRQKTPIERGDIFIGDVEEAYFLRADCDEEMNPFISDHWRGIDTTIVLDRHKVEKKEPRKRSRRK